MLAKQLIPIRKRAFALIVFDIETCPHCGGQLKMLAAIGDPVVIHKILTHLGLLLHTPLLAPTHYDPYSETDIH